MITYRSKQRFCERVVEGYQAVMKEQPHESETRDKILAAAQRLIAKGGRDAATTRAVADAAGVQAPTIYRLFGDKDGLLIAVAELGFGEYVAQKARKKPHADPVQDLREGWDTHVAFALANPGLFSIMVSLPQSHVQSSAFAAGLDVLKTRIHRIAEAGRLCVSEARALMLVQSAGVGTIMTLLTQPEEARDAELSTYARETVIAAITTKTAPPRTTRAPEAAATLNATLGDTKLLTAGERHLLRELLDRIADAG